MMTEKINLNNWNSAYEHETLARLLNRRRSNKDIGILNQLPMWEEILINRARQKLFKKSDVSISAQSLKFFIYNLAEELEIFRKGKEPDDDILDRLEHPSFKGKRDHLVRLLSSCGFDEDAWNNWRKRHGVIPDLRGADLHGLKLGHLNLSHALLRGSNLNAAKIRLGNLKDSDLRGCSLWYTDLSYAHLRSADFRNAVFYETLLTDSDLSNADLRGATLNGTIMNRANLRGANLTNSIVWGISVWGIHCNANTKQDNLIVAKDLPEQWEYDKKNIINDLTSFVHVNNLEVAHFINLAITNEKMGRVIDASADKIVLLLGRFSGNERHILNILRDSLPSFGYVPVVFDFDEPENRDTIETVSVLAGLSSFVIANLSKPRSTPLEAHLVIPAIAVPFVPIIREGEKPFAMFTALQRKYPWVLPTVTYRSEKNLKRKLKSKIIVPARKAAAKNRRLKHPKN